MERKVDKGIMEWWQIILSGLFILLIIYSSCVDNHSELEIRKNIDYAIKFDKEYEAKYWLDKLAKISKGEKQNGNEI